MSERPRTEIMSHDDVCNLVRGRIQKGINVKYRGGKTVFLMSARPHAPYPDRFDEKENILYYVGHNVHKTLETPDPKIIDQPLINEKNRPSDNARLIEFVEKFKKGDEAELVHIFEKIQTSVWADKGLFKLIDYEEKSDGTRRIFVFKLKPVPYDIQSRLDVEFEQTRRIPPEVKVAVWKRDKGQCVMCGSKENLHWDHDIPFSKGGTSLLADNIRILCAKHNLSKSNKIE